MTLNGLRGFCKPAEALRRNCDTIVNPGLSRLAKPRASTEAVVYVQFMRQEKFREAAVKWVLLVCGLLVAAIGTYAWTIYRQASNPIKDNDQIIFAAKHFADPEQVGVYGFVSMSGTLTGDRLAYPNNTYSIGCIHEQQICAVSSIEQIGREQIGRMNGPWWYPIVKWDAFEIVATDEPGAFGCVKITITIDRKQQSLLWLEEPANQNRCELQRDGH
jgi:hypothetical protein